MTPEEEVHLACVELLRWKRMAHFHPPNENAGNAAWRAKLKRMGVWAGVADLVLLPGFESKLSCGACAPVVFVEIKSPKRDLSKPQLRFCEHVSNLGYEYRVVRGVDEMDKLLREL